MSDILQQITDAGIRTDGEKTPVLKALPQYRNNYGFYHIVADKWELVFIKGVYRDNIRALKGKADITDKKLNELAQMLSDAERCLRRPATVMLAHEEDMFYIVSAETTDMPFLSADMRNPQIPQPVTSVELSLGKSAEASGKHLFSRNPFSSLFGDTVSPFAYSVLEALPEIMNPLFMSAEIKTHAPSIKTFFGRVYMNMTNFETIMSAFYTKADTMYLNFIPAIYNKLEKPSFEIPKLSALKMSDEEIVQTMDELEADAVAMDQSVLLSEKFVEAIGLSVMTWEMIYICLWHSFAKIHKALGTDIDGTLRHVYKTCPAGILNNSGSIMPYFDPAFAPVEMKSAEIETLPCEEMHKTLPASKRILLSKGRYAELMADFHKYISMRDRMYLIMSKTAESVRNILLKAAEKLLNDNIINEKNDIFFFEMKEINNIINDEFFGNIPFTLNFRRWQTARFGAMCLPNYLFEKDVRECMDIAEKQIEGSKEHKNIPCVSFFHRDTETNDYLCSSGVPPAETFMAKGRDAVITESASLFSHIMQYCAATDTPLYTGARFAPLLIKGQKIKTGKDHIAI